MIILVTLEVFMNIQKLIIHSLDQDMRTEVLSEKIMNLNEASYVMEYIPELQ